ncbi:MAG: hypothetical protein AAGA31_16410 [Bacteroidota bacterium]
MNLTEIGFTGKAHGLKGELKLRALEFYEEDLLKAKSIFVGDPPIPHFVEYFRGGGALIVKLEGLDTREQVQLLNSQPLWLMDSQVSEKEPDTVTPFDALVGYMIRAEGYPEMGPITGIVDYPQHHLAELEYAGKPVLVPLHENLILAVKEAEEVVEMQLPEGLLELGE